MIFYLGNLLQEHWGPARLLQSYTVLISLVLYIGFFVTYKILPKFYDILPHDRGREFTPGAEAAKGKPTGAGVVFITIFALLCILFVPLQFEQSGILLLTWLTMLTGFLDDRSTSSWGEYLKGALDLIISLSASFLLYYCTLKNSTDGNVYFWLPFVSHPLAVHPAVYILIGTILLWASINTTNCTDGVDGLSSTLVLIALITMGIIFYFILDLLL